MAGKEFQCLQSHIFLSIPLGGLLSIRFYFCQKDKDQHLKLSADLSRWALTPAYTQKQRIFFFFLESKLGVVLSAYNSNARETETGRPEV